MSKYSLAPQSVDDQLASFRPTKGERYDPGKLIILFDARTTPHPEIVNSPLGSYYTSTLSRFGWSSIWNRLANVDPGNIRLIWYTHVGNEGIRDFPLYKAEVVKEMFDSLATEGFRPMILGWSGENPYPMIGGSVPDMPKAKPKPRVTKTWSGTVSGHGKEGTTPHERVMAIIGEEEKREAKKREEEVRIAEKAKGIDGAV